MLAQSFTGFIHQLNIDALLGLDGKLLCFQGIDIADYEASTHSLMREGLEILMPGHLRKPRFPVPEVAM